jgi:hypothetical protein
MEAHAVGSTPVAVVDKCPPDARALRLISRNSHSPRDEFTLGNIKTRHLAGARVVFMVLDVIFSDDYYATFFAFFD